MLDQISFIIPVYNDNKYLDNTLDALHVAIERSNIKNFEILVIDDGSDVPISTTTRVARPNFQIYRYENQGRLRARLEGLNKSKFQQIVLLDSRVTIAEDSLKNLIICHSSYQQPPAMIIANINFPSDTNLVGLFWDAIARIVWFRYYVDESDIPLTREEFDSLPKGTTLLYSRKSTLINAYQGLTDLELKNKDTNDDTLLIKSIVADNHVILSKQFLATYHPRTELRSFIKHAHHRGKVARGGYFASDADGMKFLKLFLGVVTTLIAIGIYSIISSIFVVIVGVVCLEVVFARKVSIKHLLSLNLLAFPFLSAYGTGYIRSLFLARR